MLQEKTSKSSQCVHAEPGTTRGLIRALSEPAYGGPLKSNVNTTSFFSVNTNKTILGSSHLGLYAAIITPHIGRTPAVSNCY